jgi:hypothetical protein
MRTSLVCLLSLELVAAGCGTSPRQQGSANRDDRRVTFVRFVNAMPISEMPNGAAVDIFAGEQKVFPEVKPGAVMPYREIPQGLTTIRARRTGRDTDASLAEEKEMLRDGRYATILLRPTIDRKLADMTILKDHTWTPDPGKAKVRVVHAIAGMSDVDVYSQGKKLLGGVDFKDESRYVQVDPVTADLVLKRHNDQQTIATVSNLQLLADKAYTVLLLGGSDKPQTIVLEDRVEKAPIVPQPYPLSTQ